MIGKYNISSGVCTEQHSTILFTQRIFFHHHYAGRCSCAGTIPGRHYTRIFLVPVRAENILTRPLIGLPVTRSVCTEESRVSSFHQPGCSAGHHLVIIVVLPYITTRINGEFVSISEIMPDHFQTSSIGLNPQT